MPHSPTTTYVSSEEEASEGIVGIKPTPDQAATDGEDQTPLPLGEMYRC